MPGAITAGRAGTDQGCRENRRGQSRASVRDCFERTGAALREVVINANGDGRHAEESLSLLLQELFVVKHLDRNDAGGLDRSGVSRFRRRPALVPTDDREPGGHEAREDEEEDEEEAVTLTLRILRPRTVTGFS